MIQIEKQIGIALEVLDTHAKNLETEFTTLEDFQDLFIDVFGNNLDSLDNLANLRNQFTDGILRPDVKFVPSEALTDAQGIARGAAFDQQSQTILLSEDLDAAGIESSIEQEIGHWWDVQLNGTKDTTTLDGKPFDEGTAYAERFSEGTNGDNIFSPTVYQDDSQTILINGQETDLEFRPIATWNIQGNTFNNGQNTLEEVFNIMENPGQDQEPIEVMALQEVNSSVDSGPQLGQLLQSVSGVANFRADPLFDIVDGRPIARGITEFNFDRNGDRYQMFVDTLNGQRQGTAIILRNPDPNEPINAQRLENPQFRQNRGILGVQIGEGQEARVYYSVHAVSSGNNNDAELLLDTIYENRNGLFPFDAQRFILGDFNRDIAADGFPANGVGIVYQDDAYVTILIRPDDFTRNARSQGPSATLDYMFTDENLVVTQGTVLNELDNANTAGFPSDHFPVVYDDEVVGFEDANITAQVFSPNRDTEVGDPVILDIDRATRLDDTTANNSEPGNRNIVDVDISFNIGFGGNTNEILFRVVEDGSVFPDDDFNGYVFEFENLPRSIDDVQLGFVNTLGLDSSDITFDQDTIFVDVGGLDPNPGLALTLFFSVGI